MKKIAVYPGTFDPFTSGHEDVVNRALKVFDSIVIGVATSARKIPQFSLEQRIDMCQKVFIGNEKIVVAPLSDLLVQFVKDNNAKFIIKGLRGAVDFDYEQQMASINQHLDPDIETLFFLAGKYAFISGTMVREILSLKGDISDFVPPSVAECINEYRGFV